VRCFGEVHLSQGVSIFRAERQRFVERDRPLAPSRPLARSAPDGWSGRMVRPGLEAMLDRVRTELQRAESRLPHVSRGYFVTRWRSHQLPPAGHEREALVQQLVDAGLAEEFEVTDAEGRSVRAIRTRPVDDPGAPAAAPAEPDAETE
jgi:hypothetical protein